MKVLSQFSALLIAAGLFPPAAPFASAQTESITTISATPDGPAFSVDGTNFYHVTGAMWPQGSKHLLYAYPSQLTNGGTQYSFQNWSWSGGTLPLNPVEVTADPTVKAYTATFSVSYAMTINFNACSSGATCTAPGTIYVNGTPITASQQVFLPAGSTAVLQAYPDSGYVFDGWTSTAAGTITGFQANFTMNAPVVVNASFDPVQYVNLATSPAGMQVYADHNAIWTPLAMEWGLGTTHTLAPVSPQQDLQGNNWVFSSWSDGGASAHAYKVPNYPSITVTANFVAGAPVTFLTSPQGLNLNIDGRTNWPSYSFVWGVGETHAISAPSTETDSTGHIWSFSSWSQGGAATQSITVPASAAPAGLRMIATYKQVGQVTVTSALSGISVLVNGTACALPCTVQQDPGTQLTLSAPASVAVSATSRQDFQGWSNGTTGDATITLGTDPTTISANYRQMNYLATAAAPTGAASWTLKPASFDGFYDSGATVAITVSALPGYKFRAWSGDLTGSTPSGSLAMSAPHAVQAAFDQVPYIAPSGVSNGAGTTPASGVAPGSIVSVFGANLTTTTALGPSNPMVQTLDGTTVLVAGRMLPLFFISPTQINFALPADLDTGKQTVTVSTQGQSDVSATFNVIQDAPGLFPTVVNSKNYAVAVHADGSAVSSAAPVQPGETITLYGTGFGPTTPARPFGYPVPASPVYTLTDGIAIQIGSAAPVTPSAAFAVAGSVGIDAVQFTLSSDAPTATDAQLTLTVNGQVSNMVLLPLQ